MIPNNHIEIEIEIDEDGNFKRQVVGHGANTSCKLEKDDDILRELFAGLGEADDYDHTDEFYGQVKNPIVPIASDSDNGGSKGKGQKDKITLGFGI